jgi:hypothetical protein
LVEREPPPTLRQYDHVRRALHQDLLYSFARVNNCRARGADLRAHRVIVLLRRKEAGAQVEYVHEKLVRPWSRVTMSVCMLLVAGPRLCVGWCT